MRKRRNETRCRRSSSKNAREGRLNGCFWNPLPPRHQTLPTALLCKLGLSFFFSFSFSFFSSFRVPLELPSPPEVVICASWYFFRKKRRACERFSQTPPTFCQKTIHASCDLTKGFASLGRCQGNQPALSFPFFFNRCACVLCVCASACERRVKRHCKMSML